MREERSMMTSLWWSSAARRRTLCRCARFDPERVTLQRLPLSLDQDSSDCTPQALRSGRSAGWRGFRTCGWREVDPSGMRQQLTREVIRRCCVLADHGGRRLVDIVIRLVDHEVLNEGN